MLRVLLVDDEPTVCQGLQYLINWNEYGFEVAALAQNGRQALELLQAKPFDLVVTDLKMPVMDGLALIRAISELQLDCRIIIISAYGEFRYAQEAMRYGVQYYLLKPVDEDTLCGFLCRIAESESQEKTEKITEPETDKDLFRKQYGLSANGVIVEVCKYIGSHYSEQLSLTILAQVYHFSPVYMGRLFKKEMGKSFNEFLNEYRVQKAIVLINSGRYKMQEISEAVGYSDINYFYKCFKRVTGTTPKDYQQKDAQISSK